MGDKFTDGLRAVADWYDYNVDIPRPAPLLNVFPSPGVTPSKIARALGSCDKTTLGDSFFVLSREFGGISLEFNWARNAVCNARVVGTVVVPEKVTPAYTREILEWDCPQILEGEEVS